MKRETEDRLRAAIKITGAALLCMVAGVLWYAQLTEPAADASTRLAHAIATGVATGLAVAVVGILTGFIDWLLL